MADDWRKPPTVLFDLPGELFATIAGFLGVKGVIALSTACKRGYQLRHTMLENCGNVSTVIPHRASSAGESDVFAVTKATLRNTPKSEIEDEMFSIFQWIYLTGSTSVWKWLKAKTGKPGTLAAGVDLALFPTAISRAMTCKRLDLEKVEFFVGEVAEITKDMSHQKRTEIAFDIYTMPSCMLESNKENKSLARYNEKRLTILIDAGLLTPNYFEVPNISRHIGRIYQVGGIGAIKILHNRLGVTPEILSPIPGHLGRAWSALYLAAKSFESIEDIMYMVEVLGCNTASFYDPATDFSFISNLVRNSKYEFLDEFFTYTYKNIEVHPKDSDTRIFYHGIKSQDIRFIRLLVRKLLYTISNIDVDSVCLLMSYKSAPRWGFGPVLSKKILDELGVTAGRLEQRFDNELFASLSDVVWTGAGVNRLS